MYRKTELRSTRQNVRILHRGESDSEVIREEVEFLIGHDIFDEIRASAESREATYLNHDYKLIIPRSIYDTILGKYQEKS
jgi:hypothetical protein